MPPGAAALGPSATWTVADVTDSVQVKAAVAGAVEAFGRLDVVAAEMFDGFIPMGRHTSPDEVARAMLFLASDESSFITGTTLAVDGGMSI